jgi:spore photoproduct lyase
MQIDTLYIERAIAEKPETQRIRARVRAERIEIIEDYQNLFSRKKTPYLEKRSVRNLFIAVKKGALVREAPAAYGFGANDLHYYYIHAFNCIFECEYCYLQGYFSSPDLVLFVNHDEILRDMGEVVEKNPGKRVWFHAGEFSDSLALSHVSQELPLYWNFFRENPEAWLELRTKAINLTELRPLAPLPNTIVSFSLSSSEQAEIFDRGTPRALKRIEAMQRLKEMGFKLAVHFDPIIFQDDFVVSFEALVNVLGHEVGFASLEYISLGVVRFAKDVFREARENYPDSDMFARHFIQGEDNKMRYIRPLRLQLLETSKEILKKHGCPEEKIYFCME